MCTLGDNYKGVCSPLTTKTRNMSNKHNSKTEKLCLMIQWAKTTWMGLRNNSNEKTLFPT